MAIKKRTLMFCTAYSRSDQHWALRYRPWLDHARSCGLDHDLLVIIDDASPVLPTWSDLKIVSPADLDPTQGEALVTFEEHLGRLGSEDCPGWYRSFSFALDFAVEHGFEKVIHVESDAAIISSRALERVNSFIEGWLAFWTPRYNFPEMAIQVIAGDQTAVAQQLFRQDYKWLRDQSHEWAMPFTDVEKDFNGDRFGEAHLAVPSDADYTAQLGSLPIAADQWWLLPSGVSNAMLQRGVHVRNLLSGWARVEDGFVWTLGNKSSVAFLKRGFGDRYCIQVDVAPALSGSIIKYQEAAFYVGKKHLGTVLLFSRQVLHFSIDATDAVVGRCILTIHHPGHFRPCDLNGGSGDDRSIAVSLHALDVFPIS